MSSNWSSSRVTTLFQANVEFLRKALAHCLKDARDLLATILLQLQYWWWIIMVDYIRSPHRKSQERISQDFKDVNVRHLREKRILLNTSCFIVLKLCRIQSWQYIFYYGNHKIFSALIQIKSGKRTIQLEVFVIVATKW